MILGVLATLWMAWALPGIGADRAPLRPDQPPLFSADALISIDSLGRPSMGVTIVLPHSELQWVKLASGYGAGAEFTVAFEARKRSRVFGDLWERRVAVQRFSQTQASSAVIEERRVFDIPPGRYTARVQVRDLGSEQISSATSEIEVPDYSKLPVGFSQLELGLVDSAGVFTPVPTRRFGTSVDRLAARVTMFDRRPGDWPRRYPLQFRVRDSNGDELAVRTREIQLSRSGEPVIVGPTGYVLFVGAYTVEVEFSEGRSHWTADRSFEVEESGPPRGREFERMLEPLSYIAESGEIDRLRKLSTEEQVRGWEEFWRRRDPTPETVRNEAMIEFFRRVRYAEQHFQGFGPGWRSDMGRIYIRLGPPEQIEARPPTAQSPQMEIWYYTQPYRRLVFVDREGFGRYVLTNPDIE